MMVPAEVHQVPQLRRSTFGPVPHVVCFDIPAFDTALPFTSATAALVQRPPELAADGLRRPADPERMPQIAEHPLDLGVAQQTLRRRRVDRDSRLGLRLDDSRAINVDVHDGVVPSGWVAGSVAVYEIRLADADERIDASPRDGFFRGRATGSGRAAAMAVSTIASSSIRMRDFSSPIP
jgi:hypothetical protein